MPVIQPTQITPHYIPTWWDRFASRMASFSQGAGQIMSAMAHQQQVQAMRAQARSQVMEWLIQNKVPQTQWKVVMMNSGFSPAEAEEALKTLPPEKYAPNYNETENVSAVRTVQGFKPTNFKQMYGTSPDPENLQTISNPSAPGYVNAHTRQQVTPPSPGPSITPYASWLAPALSQNPFTGPNPFGEWY